MPATITIEGGMHPTFFDTASGLRRWLRSNHREAAELWIGFHKKSSGRGGITYQEALDEALCFGWIDGVRRSCDESSYTIRFTPRKPASIWSAVNIRRVGQLIETGRMTTAGLAAFARRDPNKSRQYSYERGEAQFDRELGDLLRANAGAHAFFEAQPPGYRRTAIHWVMSAKQDRTRVKRVNFLIEVSAAGERLPQIARPKGQGPRRPAGSETGGPPESR